MTAGGVWGAEEGVGCCIAYRVQTMSQTAVRFPLGHQSLGNLVDFPFDYIAWGGSQSREKRERKTRRERGNGAEALARPGLGFVTNEKLLIFRKPPRGRDSSLRTGAWPRSGQLLSNASLLFRQVATPHRYLHLHNYVCIHMYTFKTIVLGARALHRLCECSVAELEPQPFVRS